MTLGLRTVYPIRQVVGLFPATTTSYIFRVALIAIHVDSILISASKGLSFIQFITIIHCPLSTGITVDDYTLYSESCKGYVTPQTTGSTSIGGDFSFILISIVHQAYEFPR